MFLLYFVTISLSLYFRMITCMTCSQIQQVHSTSSRSTAVRHLPRRFQSTRVSAKNVRPTRNVAARSRGAVITDAPSRACPPCCRPQVSLARSRRTFKPFAYILGDQTHSLLHPSIHVKCARALTALNKTLQLE